MVSFFLLVNTISLISLFSVHPLNDPLVFGSARDNGLDGLDSDDNSEDSNAENHWMNDYPDEEDLESITEDDMVF